MKKIILNILFVILFVNNAFTQSKGFVVPDSLKGKSFEELRESFFETYSNNSKVANIYGKSYLQKAKNLNNIDTIAEAYHLFVFFDEKNTLNYLDSIISLDYKKINKIYPSQAFLEKGQILSTHNTKSALENYLLALNYANKSKSVHLQNDIKYAIGILKGLIGDNKDALSIFKDNYKFKLKYKYKEKYNYEYLLTLFALADSYHRNNLLDSATYYNKLGAKDALNKNPLFKKYFTLNEGAVHYSRKQFQFAIDSITKTLPLLENDNYNLGIAYFYLGQSYYQLKQKDNAVKKILKMDSLVQLTNYIMPEERTGYETLIEYYKEKNDLKKQLKFTERLIKSDSLLKSYHQNLSKNLALKYDIPKLVQDKNKLISKIEKKANKQYYFIKGLVLFILVLLPIILINLRAKRKLKKRFDVLLSSTEKTKKISTNTINKECKLDLSNEIIDEVLKQLRNFEKNNQFLEFGITQTKLAKKLNTNSSYLSKIINYYKKQNFSNYINDLRIDYAIEILKDDKKIRKYTIKSVAEEFGFSNSESFSKAFYRKTGIYPSYFIKQLEK